MHTTNKTAIDALTDEQLYTMWSDAWHAAIAEAGPVMGNVDAAHNAQPIHFAHAIISALAPTVQDAAPVQGMPELPSPACEIYGVHYFNAAQMYAYRAAERAAIQPAGEAVHQAARRYLACVNERSDAELDFKTAEGATEYERARSQLMKALAAPTPQAAPTVQGSVDSPDFRNSLANELKAPPFNLSPHMAYDVARLFAQRAAVAEVAKVACWDAIALAVDEAEKRNLDYVSTRILRALLKRTAPTASTPPAPAEKGSLSAAIQALRNIRDCAAFDPNGVMYYAKAENALAGLEGRNAISLSKVPAASPLMQVAPSDAGVRKAKDLLPKLHSLHNRMRNPGNIRIKCEEDSRTVGEASELCRTIINAFAAPVPPAVAPEQVQAELDRAKRALIRAGFEDCGGQDWKPPIGPAPRFIEVAATSGGEAVAELIRAADATVERWHSKDWRQPHTAEFINRLSDAVGIVKRAPQSLPAASDASVRNSALMDAADVCKKAATAYVERGAHSSVGWQVSIYLEDAIRALISKEAM